MAETWLCCYLLISCAFLWMRARSEGSVPLPNFAELAAAYPGYAAHGGRYHNHHVVDALGLSEEERGLLLPHDTSALRLSLALNSVGGPHSLGRQPVRLSKFGHDSVSGRDGLQYIFHPIAYGPFLADKYGYPSVSKLHAQDPVSTEKRFWGRQGILRVITYTRRKNMPKGHVALWDCNHFHQTQDWVAGHTLLTVEFWESPDSNCSQMDSAPRYLRHSADLSGGSYRSSGTHFSRPVPSSGPGRRKSPGLLPLIGEASKPHPKLRHKHWERRFHRRHHVPRNTQSTAAGGSSERSRDTLH